QRWI
ncbi:hypothetical protein D047_1139B, partial [Vibrio parahaemolyticus VPTS-2010_2]